MRAKPLRGLVFPKPTSSDTLPSKNRPGRYGFSGEDHVPRVWWENGRIGDQHITKFAENDSALNPGVAWVGSHVAAIRLATRSPSLGLSRGMTGTSERLACATPPPHP